MRKNRTSIVSMITLLAVLVFAVFPIYWMAVTATRTSSELFSEDLKWLPAWNLDAFDFVISQTPMLNWLRNSGVIASLTTILSLGVAFFAAYALSRYRFRGRGVIGNSLFFTQMLPEAIIIVPMFSLLAALSLLNSPIVVAIIYTGLQIPVLVWVIKTGIDALPYELEEAAQMDGASRTRTMATIVLPLVSPTITAGAVVAFFFAWNEYLFASVLLPHPQNFTASVGLAGFVGELTTPIDVVMAAGLIYALPAVAFFMWAQRYIVAGLGSGAVKG